MKKNLLLLIVSLFSTFLFAQEPWQVPEDAQILKSPMDLSDEKAILKGEKIFGKTCWTCHGEEGKGDGMAGEVLDPKPSDLTSKEVQQQSEGSLFWKIGEGRGNMAGYENVLNEDQRWQLVAFIRSLNQDEE